MHKLIPNILMILIPTIAAVLIIMQIEKPLVQPAMPVAAGEHSVSADHSQFEELQVDFETAQAVTTACLSCHNKRGGEIMQTSHWKWEREEYIEGKGVVKLGKKNVLNNFCIGVAGSEATCTRCHIGYGWGDKSFDFANQDNIDCLVCHDNTDTYQKEKGASGLPKASVDLNYVASNIGLPKKENCGICHFWGGGGNNVKHGDLEIALLDCSKDVDVHMCSDGPDMTCTECHITENHNITGKVYAMSSENKNRNTCEMCHTDRPHADMLLNEHNLRIACQTCHIPEYAKVNSTKMIWDWSTAGELDEDGHPMHWNDQDGNHKYLGIKGTFIWDDHVTPEYFWFNGTANHTLVSDVLDTANTPIQMNSLNGSYAAKPDSARNTQISKIWPVKVHRGKQIYDSKNLTLIQPKLWDKEKGQGAYWVDFDWDVASAKGMKYIGQDYSGEYDFIETEMYWPLNHMVSPTEKSLSCKECHVRDNSRLASLNDFYMPGRDRLVALDATGIILILLSLIGIFVHSTLRFSLLFKKDKENS
ncbi:MAG: tetrathionate reductase family octaheme c-type cytochrome [Bacteroidota bacterium]|nr:tetrathionate reductase family octaheme c-type cytochrome [Bacteroidota bacterium]